MNSHPSPIVEPRTSLHTAAFGVGACALIVAMGACGMMVLHHFGAMEMPGCGVGSPCDAAAKSAYGRLPIVGMPTSFLGMAYFMALLASWVPAGGRISRSMHGVILLGVLGSVIYTCIAIFAKLPCTYCFVTHGANFVFAACALILRQRGYRRAFHPIMGLATFFIASGILIAADGVARSSADAKAQTALADSIKKMQETTAPTKPATLPQEDGAATKPVTPATEPSSAPSSPITPSAPATVATPPAETTPAVATPAVGRNHLVGRYRRGPQQASIRLVMWLGYQCVDCQRLEKEVQDLLKDPTLSLSLTIKHFPLNSDCNPNAPGRHHGNACWAARAAEAAGILGGTDAFWRMSDWIFAQKGDFSNAQMNAQAQAMGFDPKVMAAMINSPQSLEPVKQDIEDAMSLGIYQTPFIFINGVELRGWNVPMALTTAVRALAKAAPAPASIANDRAPDAATKIVDDWRAMPVRQVPAELKVLAIGPADADAEVIVWGDYSEPGCVEVDGLFRLFTTTEKPNIRYVFLQFPADKACNPNINIVKFPQSCAAAKAVKAAETLAGPEGFWKMHGRLMLNPGNASTDLIEGMAMELGVSPSDMTEAMNLPDVQAMIDRESRAAMPLGLQAIPYVLVNGKHLGRWKAGYENVIPRILAAAAAEKASPAPQR